MEWLNLETSFAIIGSVAAIATTIALYIYKLKSDKSAENLALQSKFDNLNKKNDELIKKIENTDDKLAKVSNSVLEKELDQKQLKDELERIKKDFESEQDEIKKEHTYKFEKIEQKLEKFYEIILRYISPDNNNKD